MQSCEVILIANYFHRLCCSTPASPGIRSSHVNVICSPLGILMCRVLCGAVRCAISPLPLPACRCVGTGIGAGYDVWETDGGFINGE